MNIKENRIDEINIEISLTVAPEDYTEAKRKKIAEYRRKASIKGFRPGMAPMGLIEKLYGQSTLVDCVNDVISKGLNDYITSNKLRVLGEPLPSEDQPSVDWTDGNEFDFKFDIALSPEIDFTLDSSDSVVLYTITAEAKAKAEMKANLLHQYGALQEGEAAAADDFIIVDLKQGETSVEGAYIALRNVSESQKPLFLGLKAGDTVEIDVNKSFENEADRAALIKVKKEELAGLNPEWTMTVNNVKTFVNAPETQETFDKIFGEGVVKSSEEFDAKVEERLKSEYAQEADFRLQKDIREYLMAKVDIKLPEAFLKRWLFVANDGKFTKEEIEKEFPAFAVDYKWQLIREYLTAKFDVKIEDADVLASAKQYAAYQFAMYGMNNVPDEQLESFAKNILSQEKESRRIIEQVENEKVIAAVRNVISLTKKKISAAKFREL